MSCLPMRLGNGPVHEILVSDPDFKTVERNGRDALKGLALDDDVVAVDVRALRADAPPSLSRSRNRWARPLFDCYAACCRT